MDEALSKLEAEYCPPLDPALLSAIVGDYDLDTEPGMNDARAILAQLKESADVEEAAGFDPSGTGGQEIGEVLEEVRGPASHPETGGSVSRGTDLTSLSNGLSSLDLNDLDVGTTEDLEKLDEDTKVMLLQDLFGEHVSKYSIQHTLRKCGGKWNGAMEELLNHVYFGEAEDSEDGSKTPSKGIEAFSEENVRRRGRKGKPKGRKFKSLSETGMSTPEDSGSPAPNKWRTATEDVNFIASRSGIEVATVKSTYNEQRANVPRTINALIKQTMEETKQIVTDDATVQRHARELGHDFPTVASDYLAALIRLTHPSTSSAHELATALVAKPKEHANGSGGIHVIPQYARPGLQDLDPDAFQPKPRSADSSRSPDDSTRLSAYAAARAQAFTQASAAHRKAKSDRLMGGAAAYYAQVGRDYSALSASANAAAADSLASTQSTSTQLDLHGIDVLNGCRIAQQRVERWWSSMGENRVNGRVGAGERREGYSIVVGKGTHSEGGRSKLGPAVSKVLRNDGWRIEQTGAVIVVKGKQKR